VRCQMSCSLSSERSKETVTFAITDIESFQL
jgi:hypothetical protein